MARRRADPERGAAAVPDQPRALIEVVDQHMVLARFRIPSEAPITDRRDHRKRQPAAIAVECVWVAAEVERGQPRQRASKQDDVRNVFVEKCREGGSCRDGLLPLSPGFLDGGPTRCRQTADRRGLRRTLRVRHQFERLVAQAAETAQCRVHVSHERAADSCVCCRKSGNRSGRPDFVHRQEAVAREKEYFPLGRLRVSGTAGRQHERREQQTGDAAFFPHGPATLSLRSAPRLRTAMGSGRTLFGRMVKAKSAMFSRRATAVYPIFCPGRQRP